MEKELHVIGKPVQDYTGLRKVTGRARYSNDFRPSGMLHAKLLRSPYAHANIIDMDCGEAEALPGVRLVMCYKNFPDWFYKSAHYHGMEVACVVAKDKETARRALNLIRVTYEELPFVTDGKKAMEPGAPVSMPDRPNVCPWTEHQYFTDKNDRGLYTRKVPSEFDGFGDIQKGYEESEVIVEDSGYAYGFAKAPLMKQTSCLADYSDGILTLYAENQQPYCTRYWLAQSFGLPVSKVRILSEVNSCSFGGRADGATEKSINGPSCTLIAAAAALALGTPVSLEYTLDEDQLFYWGRGSFDSRFAIGFKRDGTMVMMDGEVWRNTATGGDTGESTQGVDMHATGNLLYSHNCRHNKYVKHRVYTNSPGWTGWQAFGNPEVFLPVESVMDIAAERLGMDPVELQKMNVAKKGDNFFTSGYNFDGPQFLSRSGLEPCIDAGIRHTDWYRARRKPSEKSGVLRHGMGMSPAVMENAGQGIASQAMVTLNSDGSAILYCNYQDIGQGGHGTQVQIVAEVLDIPYEKVKIKAGDTDSMYTHFQIASSGTIAQGRATYNAAADARDKLLASTAKALNVGVGTLEMRGGKVVSVTDPDMVIPWTPPMMEIVSLNPSPEVAWLADPAYDVVGYGTSFVGLGATSSELSATFVDLDVDTETGELKNIKVFHAQDCGKAINPKIVEANWLGIHHGVEAMTGAEQILDPKTGKLLNDNWIDYPVATALDCDVETQIIEIYDPTHPFGAAGVGQAIMNGLPGAFANAIYNAIGVRLKKTPFTPDKILKALQMKKEGQEHE